jgi:hypothetical protein
MKKIAGSGSASASGSISQRHGSADPDPDPDSHQNVLDPQHCFLIIWPLSSSTVPLVRYLVSPAQMRKSCLDWENAQNAERLFTVRGQSYVSSSEILTPHPPLRLASVSFPQHRRGVHRGMGGQYFGRRER